MGAMSTPSPTLPLPARQAWPALAVLCVGFFMMLLDQSIVAVATPHLQADLGASYNAIVWITAAYLFTYAVPLLVTGRLGDKFGPKKVYITGMAVFTLASVACAFAPSSGWLIAARALQGLGAALLSPQTMSIINRIFPKDKLGSALGIWGATAGIAGMTGPIAGGFITEYWGWQWIFLINVPIGICVVLAAARWLPEFPPLPRRLDPGSIILSIIAVFLVVFSIQQGEVFNWAWWIWVLLVAGLAVFAIFIRRQATTHDEPLVPLRIFSNIHFSTGNVGIFAMGMTVASIPLPLMLYFQKVHGLNASAAGAMMICQAGISFLLSPLVGKLVDKSSPTLLAVFGFSTMTLSITGLSLAMVTHAPLWAIGIALAGLGIGNAFIWAPNSRSTLGDLPGDLAGAGSGVYNTTRQVGAVVGTAAVGALLQLGVGADQGAKAYGFSISVLIVAMLAAVGVTVWTAIQDRRRG
ncbi:permease of the major facilitator superfamily [Corynebacterium renale]|uniref:EmrB/QacA subfamily drug resistance transporter n=2 Tax=Corynebacterium renale TaxID=1724 RepID=A0A2A9DR77_9CORY|nr:EmrB/QacA subfamily drug resistance transporter [Corynebacterium renale]SQI25618.1 permease of the major facilitator superfamily [Corynebacterium renale]